MKYFEYIKRYKIFIILIIIGIVIGIYFVITKEVNVDSSDLGLVESNLKEEKTESIFVDIKGEVVKPGVYELNVNSKVNDLISKSGGLTSNADTSTINLSKTLLDEMVVIIYSVDEINEMKKGSNSVKIVEKECICPKIENNACIENKETNYTNNSNNSTSNNTTTDKVSLNKAGLKELMTLTGIGESKAKAIIEYREKNGSFKSIEEITKVSGIGTATYAKIKDKLTL